MTEPNTAAARLDDTDRLIRASNTANAIAFGLLFALSAAFLFVSYCMARGLISGFGLDYGVIATAVIATAFASIFLWWLVPFADSGEILSLHLPADRRANRGQCPYCGYPHESRAVCNECGAATAPLPPWVLSARPVRRMAVILLAAMAVGCTAGEWWCRVDESRFEAESTTIPNRPYSRARAFPSSFAKMTVDKAGKFTSEPWPEDGRDRSWKYADPALRERGLGWRERSEAAKSEQAPQ
jgi:hypothetical protein